ncbi:MULTISPECIES: hypothetical protein [Curtobacterium]|uniref:hypothetical protein n=1 Tax=Curtobacterium flaccumfaciens TaxID=2035 RepID=UPI003EE73945
MGQTITDSGVMNFLEDEEFEDTPSTPELPTEQPLTHPEPALNQKLHQLDPSTETVKISPVKRPSGTRITEGNAQMVRFLSKFPGATSEALSIIAARKDQAAAGQLILPTVKGTEKRLRKMESLGAIERLRDATSQTVQYSATQLGIDALWSFGYNAEHAATLHKKAKTRAAHYRYIAHVAAQFASPQGFFRDSLGIEPVALEQLISENEMRGAYEPINLALKQAGKQGQNADYGRWRKTELEAALSEAGNKRLDWSDIVEAHPALLTMGQPKRTGAITKPVHQGDLAVILDGGRTGTKARNLLVEVELSKKSWDEYSSILATLKMELEHGFIYCRAVYFTVGTQVETLLRKIDKKLGYGLFESGKLSVLPILNRTGDPVRFDNRITLGGF